MEVHVPEISDQNSNHKGQFEGDLSAGPEMTELRGVSFIEKLSKGSTWIQQAM